jgi:tetratricopeptide (TPR) repeat protein
MAFLGCFLISAGQLKEGLAEEEKALELAPNLVLAHMYKAWALRGLSRYQDAVAALETGITLTGGNLWLLGELAITQAKSGRLEEAQAILDEARIPEVEPAVAAAVYGVMGRIDHAFELLERAFQLRDPNLPLGTRGHPDSAMRLRDARIQKLFRQLDLP